MTTVFSPDSYTLVVVRFRILDRPVLVVIPGVTCRAAQSSWVAGGYWSPPSGKFGSRGSSFVNRTPYLGGGSPSAGLFQFGIPTVSRCSSQSSGFGSIGKGANPFETHGNPVGGATTSLSGQRGVNNANFNSDFDRFSVVSEPPPELNSRHTLPRYEKALVI